MRPRSCDIRLPCYSRVASLTPSSRAGLNANTLHSTHHLTRAICSLLSRDKHVGKTTLGHMLLPPTYSMCLMPHISFPQHLLNLGRNQEINRSSCSRSLISTTFFLTPPDHIKCPAFHSLQAID